MGWKKHKVRELDQIARAIDTDTITVLKGCSSHAKDVLKTSLPHNYTSELHREMLEYDNGHLVSMADYYAMCSDSIRSRFGIDKPLWGGECGLC